VPVLAYWHNNYRGHAEIIANKKAYGPNGKVIGTVYFQIFIKITSTKQKCC
jgi:hypothetical protein